MRFQKRQAAGAATYVTSSASAGPLKNMDSSSPARKAHAHEMHEKACSISNTSHETRKVLGRCSYMNKASKVGPHTHTGRGTCHGAGL